MKDFAVSEDPRVQAQLDRLAALSLPQGRFGLETIHTLLERLGNPQKRLPPTFHVAGTNGKGSTCAYLRFMLEAQGLKVHSATKPHLVRYNERIRLGGKLISDAMLADLLAEVLDAGEDLQPSFFEVTTAAIFLAFAREPADACVIEVGLGGRLDATNVLEHPAACGIVTLGIDHEAFLLRPEDGAPEEPLARIAFEKAGIVRSPAPVITLAYPESAELEIERAALTAGAPLHMRGRDWDASVGDVIEYSDRHGELTLPLPSLPGTHQAENAALAVAMLRHQDRVTVSAEAMADGIRAARWPARLQLLSQGPLTRHAGARAVWLDGGHNPDAGLAIARHFAGQRLHLVIGMLANKDPRALNGPLRDSIVSIHAVPVPGQDCHGPTSFGPSALAAGSVEEALAALPEDGLPVLIAGSLYLSGEVLRANDEIPD
ncbi:dihydrofolate synthase/folylpolyglutamate synthase [Novosphingobium sp. PhB165]|uniref:bifunctional folylpolyglutamate synthase/dihydrofolate synthase n=1 Tax=Novosphingobium sp. PhB165 TaxID=2485105 RepID=UPI001048A416|nr:folylpolyglutamate synthase/dihydrofolate synthase family protein [Novosphingobium sp. PhB165]TCM21550.1 dihydrofolate synthase/folylpolyglutamate synthase [Novosphingobium sp. PhB165]